MGQRILVIDNYDSFTYNLVQELGVLGAEIEVVRNDASTPTQIAAERFDGIVISPGPCTPMEAGISVDVIRKLGAAGPPILGVCLGHQCVAAAYGGEVVRAQAVMHGKTSMIQHDGQGLYKGLPNPFEATRYHSLVVRPQGLPDCLAESAWAERQVIMGIAHRDLPVYGVQFHPESVLTLSGPSLLANFLDMCQGADS